MKVVAISEFGGIDKFHETDFKLPDVKKGYVRIKINATSFNPVDWKLREGKFGGDFPMVLGQDSAGVVDAVGEGVQKFKAGDEVYVFVFGISKSNGGYAEYVSIPQEFAAIKPKKISFEEASGVPLVGLTALDVVNRARIVKGEPVFVTGASGGVGSLVVQLLRYRGASPIVTTAGSEASAEYIHSHLGIPKEHIVRYDQYKSADDLVAAVKKHTKDSAGFPVSIDLVGDEMKHLAFKVLKLSGHILTIVEEYDKNFVTPLYPIQSPQSLFMLDATFSTVFIGAKGFTTDPLAWATYGAGLEELQKLIDGGHLVPPKITVVGTLSAATIQKAHKDLQEGHTKGKLIVVIP